MRRRLFTALSVLSPMMCVATAGARLRSYWVRDDLTQDTYGVRSGRVFHRALLVSSGRGGLALAAKVYTNGDPIVVTHFPPPLGGGADVNWRVDGNAQYPTGGPMLPNASAPWWNGLGFGISIERQRFGGG